MMKPMIKIQYQMMDERSSRGAEARLWRVTVGTVVMV